MGKMQRNKGAQFEREIANDLSATFLRQIKRKLGQARDSGNDIDLPPFRIECKRYQNIAVYTWLEQCVAACKPQDVPVVVARADNKPSIIVMLYQDFKKLASELLDKQPMDIFNNAQEIAK